MHHQDRHWLQAQSVAHKQDAIEKATIVMQSMVKLKRQYLRVLVRQLLQRLQALLRQVDVLDGQQPRAEHLQIKPLHISWCQYLVKCCQYLISGCEHTVGQLPCTAKAVRMQLSTVK
jgi:hypothetical protein